MVVYIYFIRVRELGLGVMLLGRCLNLCRRIGVRGIVLGISILFCLLIFLMLDFEIIVLIIVFVVFGNWV